MLPFIIVMIVLQTTKGGMWAWYPLPLTCLFLVWYYYTANVEKMQGGWLCIDMNKLLIIRENTCISNEICYNITVAFWFEKRIL